MSLRIPGPTPCPDEVLKIMSRQMIGHRGKEFAELVHRVTLGTKEIFQPPLSEQSRTVALLLPVL